MHWMTKYLRKVLEQNSLSEIPQRLKIAKQIASGIACLHSASLMHRDLKPDNIMLDDNNNAYIGDFGLAQVIDLQNTWTASVLYAAPEIINGVAYGSAVDIYAFGIIMWELWPKPPDVRLYSQTADYSLAGVKDFLDSVVSGNRPIVTDSMKMDKKFRALMMQCWNGNPIERPTAATVCSELTLLLNDNCNN